MGKRLKDVSLDLSIKDFRSHEMKKTMKNRQGEKKGRGVIVKKGLGEVRDK